MNPKTQKKHCKECSIELTLTSNKSTSNVSPSEYKLSNPRCKECRKKYNKKNNPNKGIRTPYAKSQKEKIQRIRDKGKSMFRKDTLSPQIKSFFYLEPNLEFNAEYISLQKIQSSKLPLAPTAIQSVMGTGKTAYVEYFMKEAQKQNLRVLYICPNVTTAQSTYDSLCAKLPVTHYSQTKNGVMTNPEMVISTVDSCDQWLSYDVLIVDEVLSLFSETTLKTSNLKNTDFAIWNSKYKAIMQHSCPIVLDRYVGLVLPLFDADFFVIRNNYKKTKTINDYSNVSRDQFIDLAIDTAKNKTVAFHSNWISSICKLEEKALSLGISTKSIHSKSTTNIKEIHQAQLQCSTSKLSRGIDLDTKEVFLQDTGNTHSVITALQMIDRSRQSKVINIRVKAKGNKLKRVYESYSPLDKYEQRLHLFDVKMSILDNNYTKVLFFMIRDTYKKPSVIGLRQDTQTTLDNIINSKIHEFANVGKINDLYFDDDWVQWVTDKLDVNKEQIKRSIELFILVHKDTLLDRIS